jgi:hypothetical protein
LVISGGIAESFEIQGGGDDVTVAEFGCMSLEPGPYGQVQVQSEATLLLGSGRYQFESLFLADKASVRYVGAGEIRIESSLEAGADCRVGPSGGSEASASEFVLYVGVMKSLANRRYSLALIVPLKRICLPWEACRWERI